MLIPTSTASSSYQTNHRSKKNHPQQHHTITSPNITPQKKSANMSVAQSMKHISNLERKLGKANKIAAKGSDMKLSDVLKLQSKSNAICSEIKKSMAEYDVRHALL